MKIVNFNIEKAISHPTFIGVKLYPILTEESNLGIRSNFALISPGGEIAPHTHDVVEVFTIMSGTPHVLIDGVWTLVNQGTTIVAPPGEIHGVRNCSDNGEDVLLQANFNVTI